MVSFIVLVAILLAITALFVRVMWGFLLPLFLAAMLGVVFQPVYAWSLDKCRGYRYVASTMSTLIVLLIVLVPAGLIATLAAMQGLSIVDQFRAADIRGKLEHLRDQFELNIPGADDLRRIEASLKRWRQEQREGNSPQFNPQIVGNLMQRVDALGLAAGQANLPVTGVLDDLRSAFERLRQSQPDSFEGDEALQDVETKFRDFKREYLGGTWQAWLKEAVNPTDDQIEELRRKVLSEARSPLLSIGGDTLALAGRLIFGVVIMVVTLFFLFAEGGKMLNAAIRLLPLEERYVRELVDEFERVCRAVVAATLLSAAAQGVLAGIGFYFAGLQNSVALLMLLTMLLAMVPFAGAAAVWLPVALYLYFVADRPVPAIMVALWGALVVSTIDNLIKPYVLHGQSNLHPLLALLSVIGGLQTLGPIGILVGPMVVVFLQTLLKIMQRELLNMDWAAGSAAASALATAGGGAAAVPTPNVPPLPDPAVARAADRAVEQATQEALAKANANSGRPAPPPVVRTPPAKKKRRR
jgi:predicted PurR-regulated permease PerM